MERAFFFTCSSVGISPVTVYRLPHTRGVELYLLLGNDLNPKVLIERDDIEAVAAQLSTCGDSRTKVILNKGHLSSTSFTVKPLETGICWITYFSWKWIMFGATSFKIETSKIREIGERLASA